MQSVLSRAVAVLPFASLFASQGLSPWSRTVYCVPYSTITPVLRRVLSASRAIYYKIALSCKSYIASVITGSYATASPDIRQFRSSDQGHKDQCATISPNISYVNCMALLCNLIREGIENYDFLFTMTFCTHNRSEQSSHCWQSTTYI